MFAIDILHDSRNPIYRAPFGAAECGSQVRLGLTLTGAPGGTVCRLVLTDTGKTVDMSPVQGDLYAVTIRMPDSGSLVFYHFEIRLPDGSTVLYGNNPQRRGGVGRVYVSAPVPYQITAYKRTETPDWYKTGIAYQIFPDRFFRGDDWLRRQEDAGKASLGTKRLIHQSWDDKPFYTKDERGEVTRWGFFGGTLEGIREKLSYLRSLGITIVYLNPIFMAASNHKYDTADYTRIDPSFGDEESFRRLMDEGEKRGIRFLLDGVFSHTGADSVYFNRFGTFKNPGAWQGPDSPYYRWYRFKAFPEKYECWWGVCDLPNVSETEPTFSAFIHGKPDGIVRRWLRLGASGWRLDVADELPDSFIKSVRAAMDETKPDSVLLGEVWEDASNKISYGQRREYLLGEELQSTMNYPLRSALLDFMLGRTDAADAREALLSLMENYPPESFYGALNLIGSHDTRRILTVLGDAPELSSEKEREGYALSSDKYALAVLRLKLLSLLQFTFPGVPCIYYGDEAGMQGFEDPYNRGPFPWGHEDAELTEHYRALAALRQSTPAFTRGSLEITVYGRHILGLRRRTEGEDVLVLVNRGIFEHETARIPEDRSATDLLSGSRFDAFEGYLTLKLEPLTALVLRFAG